MLAHMSQDTALLEAFRQGEDIHARTAALIYDLPQDQISPDQRRNAKTINLASSMAWARKSWVRS